MPDCRSLLALGALFAGLSLPLPAAAGSFAQEMAVSAEVESGCKVSATPMNFGMITGATADVRTTATIALDCIPRIDYEITLDRGENPQGRQRRMANSAGTRFLRYDIYSDAGHSREWDDRGGRRRVTGNSGPTGQRTHTAYGEIMRAAAQSATGPFRDTVVVTVDF